MGSIFSHAHCPAFGTARASLFAHVRARSCDHQCGAARSRLAGEASWLQGRTGQEKWSSERGGSAQGGDEMTSWVESARDHKNPNV